MDTFALAICSSTIRQSRSFEIQPELSACPNGRTRVTGISVCILPPLDFDNPLAWASLLSALVFHEFTWAHGAKDAIACGRTHRKFQPLFGGTCRSADSRGSRR